MTFHDGLIRETLYGTMEVVIPFPQRMHVSRDDGGFPVKGPTSLAESATDVSGDN